MGRLYVVTIPLPAVTPPVVALCLQPADGGGALRLAGRIYTNSTAGPAGGFVVASAFSLASAAGGAAGAPCVVSDASQACTAQPAYGS
jgi:hypothetical protein